MGGADNNENEAKEKDKKKEKEKETAQEKDKEKLESEHDAGRWLGLSPKPPNLAFNPVGSAVLQPVRSNREEIDNMLADVQEEERRKKEQEQEEIKAIRQRIEELRKEVKEQCEIAEKQKRKQLMEANEKADKEREKAEKEIRGWANLEQALMKQPPYRPGYVALKEPEAIEETRKPDPAVAREERLRAEKEERSRLNEEEKRRADEEEERRVKEEGERRAKEEERRLNEEKKRKEEEEEERMRFEEEKEQEWSRRQAEEQCRQERWKKKGDEDYQRVIMENRLCEEARLMRVEAAAAKLEDSSSTDPKKIEKPLTEEEEVQHYKQVADEQRRQKEKREAGPRPALIDLGWSKKKEKLKKLFGFGKKSVPVIAPVPELRSAPQPEDGLPVESQTSGGRDWIDPPSDLEPWYYVLFEKGCYFSLSPTRTSKNKDKLA